MGHGDRRSRSKGNKEGSRKGRKQRVESSSSNSSKGSRRERRSGKRESIGDLKEFLEEKFEEVKEDGRAFRESVDKRFEAQDARLKQIDTKFEDVEETLIHLRARLQVLEVGNAKQLGDTAALGERIAKAETHVPVRQQRGFERPPNPTRVKANGKDLIAKAEVEKVLFESLLDNAHIAHDHVSVEGPEVGRRFFIQFSGVGQLAVDEAQRLLRSLKNGDKTWKEIFVPDPQQKQTQVFFSEDLGPRLEKLSLLTKKLGVIFSDLYPDPAKRVYTNRETGIVSFQWQDLAKVDLKSATEVALVWNTEVLKDSGFDTKAISKAFDQFTRGKSNVTWTSSS